MIARRSCAFHCCRSTSVRAHFGIALKSASLPETGISRAPAVSPVIAITKSSPPPQAPRVKVRISTVAAAPRQYLVMVVVIWSRSSPDRCHVRLRHRTGAEHATIGQQFLGPPGDLAELLAPATLVLRDWLGRLESLVVLLRTPLPPRQQACPEAGAVADERCGQVAVELVAGGIASISLRAPAADDRLLEAEQLAAPALQLLLEPLPVERRPAQLRLSHLELRPRLLHALVLVLEDLVRDFEFLLGPAPVAEVVPPALDPLQHPAPEITPRVARRVLCRRAGISDRHGQPEQTEREPPEPGKIVLVDGGQLVARLRAGLGRDRVDASEVCLPEERDGDRDDDAAGTGEQEHQSVDEASRPESLDPSWTLGHPAEDASHGHGGHDAGDASSAGCPRRSEEHTSEL